MSIHYHSPMKKPVLETSQFDDIGDIMQVIKYLHEGFWVNGHV